MKHTIKEWIMATRYWSFPVSTMPVVVTFAYLLSLGMVPDGIKPYICLLLSLLGVVVLHSAGNVISDYFDYKTGVDNPDSFAVPNLVFHKFEPKEYLTYSIFLFIIGAAIGILIVLLSDISLLYIGGIGIVLTALYSFFKYHALGDLDIFIIFSCLIMLGTSVAITGAIVPETLVLALPVGIITVSVLHANNTFDIESDGKAGMKSFAMILGGKASARLYQAYMIIPFLSIIVLVACGHISILSLISLIAAVPAYQNIKSASHYSEKGIMTMAGLDQSSAKLQLIFSLLLSLGMILGFIFGI